MKKIGVFLGIAPRAGGMLQYSISILDALLLLRSDELEVEIAYAFDSWEPILATYPFKKTKLYGAKSGLFLADAFMALKLPGGLSRVLSLIFNPLAWQLRKMKRELWIFPAQDALTYQAGVPALGVVHDLMHRYEPHFPEVAGKGRGAIRDHRFRELLNWSSAVLVDSTVGKNQVMESYQTPAEKIFILPYIPSKYIYEKTPAEDFDRKYELPKRFVFYPAQFWAHKNHPRLILASVELASRHPDFNLVLTGLKSHDYPELVELVKEKHLESRVHFMGYVPDGDLAGFYRRAQALVMPTFFGPTNIPPLEAFVCGCPVAVSGIYGMPEQVGDAALLFDPRSEQEMEVVMERLWMDSALRQQLIERGKARAQEWSFIPFSKKLDAVLNHLKSGRIFK